MTNAKQATVVNFSWTRSFHSFEKVSIYLGVEVTEPGWFTDGEDYYLVAEDLDTLNDCRVRIYTYREDPRETFKKLSELPVVKIDPNQVLFG